MYRFELDEMLKENVITQDEYDNFLSKLYETENGELCGGYPLNDGVMLKYDFDGDLFGEPLCEFVKKRVKPPIGAEYIDRVFAKYGYTCSGEAECWVWFTKENIGACREQGYLPIEEAPETDLWKMMAISSRLWECRYKRWYEVLKRERNKNV